MTKFCWELSVDEKKRRCLIEFMMLKAMLGDEYELVESAYSAYLVPKGTTDQVTWYGKPDGSFRFSDHWNWYANTKKCTKENYIQCYSVDMPYAKGREAEGKASKPIFGWQISYYDPMDHKYHCIFGEKYDRHTRKWTWIDRLDTYMFKDKDQ